MIKVLDPRSRGLGFDFRSTGRVCVRACVHAWWTILHRPKRYDIHSPTLPPFPHDRSWIWTGGRWCVTLSSTPCRSAASSASLGTGSSHTMSRPSCWCSTSSTSSSWCSTHASWTGWAHGNACGKWSGVFWHVSSFVFPFVIVFIVFFFAFIPFLLLLLVFFSSFFVSSFPPSTVFFFFSSSFCFFFL